MSGSSRWERWRAGSHLDSMIKPADCQKARNWERCQQLMPFPAHPCSINVPYRLKLLHEARNGTDRYRMILPSVQRFGRHRPPTTTAKKLVFKLPHDRQGRKQAAQSAAVRKAAQLPAAQILKSIDALIRCWGKPFCPPSSLGRSFWPAVNCATAASASFSKANQSIPHRWCPVSRSRWADRSRKQGQAVEFWCQNQHSL